MSDEINEMIRVLQLTTYDEEEWDADNLTVMKKALNAVYSKQQAAHDWLMVLRTGLPSIRLGWIQEGGNQNSCSVRVVRAGLTMILTVYW